ncbi:hypothetical protein B0H16DRAFT_1456406 [Mycena metata]|uniref:Uncharacterized protein n=1 Tax=Mycena metata TaxID=1033252 RepID=A0AAD7JDD4_9AGAR|nr:hypothetical protein B0H16DRAFT_1456406 [Mycena metata]
MSLVPRSISDEDACSSWFVFKFGFAAGTAAPSSVYADILGDSAPSEYVEIGPWDGKDGTRNHPPAETIPVLVGEAPNMDSWEWKPSGLKWLDLYVSLEVVELLDKIKLTAKPSLKLELFISCNPITLVEIVEGGIFFNRYLDEHRRYACVTLGGIHGRKLPFLSLEQRVPETPGGHTRCGLKRYLVKTFAIFNDKLPDDFTVVYNWTPNSLLTLRDTVLTWSHHQSGIGFIMRLPNFHVSSKFLHSEG